VAGAPPDGIGGFLDRLLDIFERRGKARTFKDVRDRLIILLAVDLLGRNSDIARLRLNDVNIDSTDDMHLTLRVRGDKTHVAMGLLHGGHAVNHIFCSTPKHLCTVCTMRKYLALRPAGGEFLLVKAPSGASSVSATGHELSSATVAHILKQTLSDAGAPNATPHTLRGMGASALFAASWDEGSIRQAGRWASTKSVRPYTAASLTGILPCKNLALSYADHGACILTKERRWYAGATLRLFMATTQQ
jgi:integrase